MPKSNNMVFDVRRDQYEALKACAARAGVSPKRLARSVLDIFLSSGVCNLERVKPSVSRKA